MAITINGSATITGLSVGGLPDGVVDSGTLATNSVDSDELVSGAVDSVHLASGVAGDANKVVQYAKVKNTSAVQTTSTTFADLTGVTVSLTGVTVGNILEISGIVPIRKNTGYISHPGVGIKVDNTLIDNSSWGTGVDMTTEDIWITKFPVLTFYTATATSHTVKMVGNVNSSVSVSFGGEMSGSTAHDYTRIWMIVKELAV